MPVAGEGFGAAVTALVSAAGGRVPAASIGVPDDFVRVATVELEDPRHQQKETEDILRWKLEKLFGEPVPPLRLAWKTAGQAAGGVRVVAIAAPEEAAASWEDPFNRAGVRIGALETSCLALAPHAGRLLPSGGLFLWAGSGTASTLFFRQGRLEFMRTRPVSDADEALQEVRLASSFFGGDGAETPFDLGAACIAGPAESEVVTRFLAFRAENGGAPATVVTAGMLGGAGTAPTADPGVLAGLGVLSRED